MRDLVPIAPPGEAWSDRSHRVRTANNGNPYVDSSMKNLTALAVVTLASQAVVAFAGEPVVSSKQVIAPTPPPPEYFRPNEWDIGAFATYATGTGQNPTGTRVRDGFTTTLSAETSFTGGGAGRASTNPCP